MAIPSYPTRGSALLRHGRCSEHGRVYLVTFTTASRAPLFAEWETALAAVRALQSPHIWKSSRLQCWVLMPDHWHGLVELDGTDELSTLVHRVKGFTAHAINVQLGRRGALWAEGFHDHAVRTDEDVQGIARYIILNPVRAGLVRHVGLYPFWDAQWLDGTNRNPADEEHRD